MKKRYLLALIPLSLLFFGCKKKSSQDTKITTKETTKITTKETITTKKDSPIDLLDDYYYVIEGDDIIILGVKNKEATELVVPEGVTKIEDDDDLEGFRDLENLEKITLPKSLEEIEDGSFAGCIKLVEIYNLSNIDLKVNDPDDETCITEYAYIVHKSLDEPSCIVKKDNYSFIHTDTSSVLFNYTGNEKHIVTPSSYTYNGDTVTSYDIAKEVFKKKDMVSLVLSDAVNVIDSYAFGGCYNLSSVTVGKNVTEIKSHAFGSDARLDDVYTVGMYNECNRLVEVINKSNLDIEKGSKTNGRIAKNAIVVKDENATSSIVESNNFIFLVDDSNAYLTCYLGDSEVVETPSSFTYNGVVITNYAINDYGLAYRKNMKKLIISDAVTKIGSEIIKNSQFYRENKTVEEIIIGNNVTYISANALNSCTVLNRVIIGSKIEEIDNSAFAYCSNLIEIVILKDSPFTLGYRSFYKYSSSGNKPYEKVLFKGDKASFDSWSSADKGMDNEQFFNAPIYFYSQEEPTDDGNYWIIVNGEIIIWEKKIG